jgi:membrane protease YdiL (CAAX protease family)
MNGTAMGLSAAIAWASGCFVFLQALVFILASLRPGLQNDIVTLGGCAAAVYLLGSFGVLQAHAREAPLRQCLALRPTHPALVAIGVGLGLSLKLPAESLRDLMERQWPSTDAELLRRAVLYQSENLRQMLGLLLVVCLMGPLVEEIFFRGALYGRLARNSARTAGLATGLMFVLTHADFRAWPALVVVTAALSYLRGLSGSLLPCVAFHVAFNTLGVLALVTRTASPTAPFGVSAPLVFASWLVAAVLLVVAVRLADTESVVRARAEDEA